MSISSLFFSRCLLTEVPLLYRFSCEFTSLISPRGQDEFFFPFFPIYCYLSEAQLQRIQIDYPKKKKKSESNKLSQMARTVPVYLFFLNFSGRAFSYPMVWHGSQYGRKTSIPIFLPESVHQMLFPITLPYYSEKRIIRFHIPFHSKHKRFFFLKDFHG